MKSEVYSLQEVDSRRLAELEDTVRLKNKQIHQLLEVKQYNIKDKAAIK